MKRLQLDIPLMDKTLPTSTPTIQYHPTGNAFIENNILLVSPQYDADVKTGRALALGATNDLPIPTHLDGYITYHNLDTNTITQEATDGTDKVFNTITINNILTHKMPFSAGDLNLIQQEPNTLAALAMGEVTPISSVTLDADDSWYACSEVSGAYVVDQRAGYGVENADVTTWTPQISGAGNSITATGTAGEYDIVQVIATDNTYTPRIIFNNANFIVGERWKIDITINITSGSMLLYALTIDGADNIIINQSLSVGTHTFSYIFSVWSGSNTIQFNGQTETTCESTIGVEILSATASEIALHDESIRITNQQKGLQTTALLLDGAGVPESYNSTPNTARVYDDTIISTGFKPSIARYSIEEESSGLMQDFGVDSKQSATSTPAGVVES